MANEPSDAQTQRPTAGQAPPLQITLDQLLPRNLHIAVPGELRFDPEVPFAVTLAFRPPRGPAIEWVIGRDLLWDGVLEPAGIHDVRITPVRRHGRLLLRIRLGAGGASAVFETDLPAIEQWLLDTYDAVPFGEDLTGVDWDAHLAGLLDGR